MYYTWLDEFKMFYETHHFPLIWHDKATAGAKYLFDATHAQDLARQRHLARPHRGDRWKSSGSTAAANNIYQHLSQFFNRKWQFNISLT